MIPNVGLETMFALFGMFLVVMGLAGSQRVKVVSIEVGPLRDGWRVVAVVIGLLTMLGIGVLHMHHDHGTHEEHAHPAAAK